MKNFRERIYDKKIIISFGAIIFFVVAFQGLRCVEENTEGRAGNQIFALPYIIDSEGDFQKVERPYQEEDMEIDLEGASQTFIRGEVVSKRVRPHMRPDPNHNQSALNVGEYFVMDISAATFGDAAEYNEDEIRQMDLYVVSNFELVPFFLDQVKSSEKFVSLESLKVKYKEEVATIKAGIIVKNEIPAFFSIVIPPSSFPKAGAYDMRIVAVANGPTSYRKPLRSVGINFSHTLFYGGDQFPPLPKEIDTPPQIRLNTEVGFFFDGGLFSRTLILPGLEPPTKDEPSINETINLRQDSEIYAIFRPESSMVKHEPVVISFLINDNLVTLGTIYPKPHHANGIQQDPHRMSYPLNDIGDASVNFIVMDNPLMDQGLMRGTERGVDVSNTLNVRVIPDAAQDSD